MARKKIIYIVSPRSAFSWNPGRKISSIIELWSKSYDVTAFFGGDLVREKNDTYTTYGNANIHKKAYNNFKPIKPLVHTYSELKDIFHNIKSFIFLNKKYNQGSFDIVWERSSRLHFSGLMYAKKNDLPYVLEWKDNLINYKFSLFKFFALYVERYKCKQADRIIVESNVLKKELIVMGYDSKKILVTHNAADADLFERNDDERAGFRKLLNIEPDTTVVGYLGSYAFYHNSALFVKAANIIKKQYVSTSIVFLMVGDGLDYKECRDLAEQYSFDNEYFKFLPPVSKEEVPSILSAIDISVLPGSTTIISPIKVLEYMASGAAPVVPDYECNREIIANDENGSLFKPNDEIDLAEKIIELVKDVNHLAEMSLKAVHTAKVKFSWSNTWGSTLEKVFNDLVKEKTSNENRH